MCEHKSVGGGGEEGRRLHPSDKARRSRLFRGAEEEKKTRGKPEVWPQVVPVADGGAPPHSVSVGGAGADARGHLDDAVQRPDHAAGAQHAHQAHHAVELRRRRWAGRALGEGGRRGEGGGGAAATVAAAQRTILQRRPRQHF